MIAEGFRLMVVGMVTVFAFLTLLVALMRASTAFFEKFADRFPEEAASDKPSSASRDHGDEIALAIAVADAHRRGQRV